MGLAIETINGAAGAIRISGELDRESVERLWGALLDLYHCAPIIVDAAGVESMNLSGLDPFRAIAELSDGCPVVVIRNPSRAVRRVLSLGLPGGCPGLWVEFTGAGPGAAHRMTELLRSTQELHAATKLGCERAATAIANARRARSRLVSAAGGSRSAGWS